ncbi:CDF family Co(II)/Ni(II) efflux transporter DmeF [Bradyrhizobium sp. ARR65]|uniref:CDF family Co(II)/Ni(II) efflux transporter DmeF n=1 Tax=Bradyrhizobium sp. ARR65 TaxID=1040989 RepID=UPI0004631C10|nr:CDF family Co(II)/Ni(II) efflux transporter DmeF [Bradyrhizobium sp. ARR65]
MADVDHAFQLARHEHVFLGRDHDRAERRTWAVIVLCGVMMVAEIVGGALFGSLALIADGLHMSTHAGALLLAALAYTYARKYAHDRSFTFGTGKFGDLAGYTSAIVLAMIALLIGYEAVERLLNPVQIHFDEAIPIAVVGLIVNVASAWLLSGGHDHGNSHGHHVGHHGHAHHEQDHHHGEAPQLVTFGTRELAIEIFEHGTPPRFRIIAESGALPMASDFAIETVRPDGSRQLFAFADRGGYLESREEVPEPHAFVCQVSLLEAGQQWRRELRLEEHEHSHDHDAAHRRDNNMRAAIVHVMADAAVSVLVIAGLLLGRGFGWAWMDPLAGLIGALVIANWSIGLLRDTGGILLDRLPDSGIAEKVRQAVESEGDQVTDLHLWRLGPGHLGAIVSVATSKSREAAHYRRRLARFTDLSHVTVEVQHAPRARG